MTTTQDTSEPMESTKALRLAYRPPSSQRFVGSLAGLGKRLNGGLALVDQGIVSATNFATGLIIGRSCSKDELGLYMLGWTLTLIATEISAALITTPYTVFSPTLDTSRLRKYRGSMLVHQCLLSIVFAALISVGAATMWWMGTASGLPNVLWSLATVVLFIVVRDFMRRVCFAHLKMMQAIAMDSVSSGVQIAGLLLLARLGYLSASKAYLLLGVASVIACVAWIVKNNSSYLIDTRSWLTDARDSWSFGKWILASGLVWAIAMYLYPWILTIFHGTAATGTWAACYSVVALGNPVLLGLGNYVGPKVANIYAAQGIAGMRKYVYRSSLGFSLLVFPLCVTLAAWGGILVTRMYGKAYMGNSVAVSLLAANLLLSAFAFPYSRGLFVIRLAKVDLFVNLIAIALLFTVGLQFVRIYSVIGAALALTLSNAATLSIRMFAFARSTNAISHG
jgi:O-antigen/teichoic acid export membrane protein